MAGNKKQENPMPERRRDQRLDVQLPFHISADGSDRQCHCHTVDISPTGLLVEIDDGIAPDPGSIVEVAVQGPAETGWEHINARTMRVVRAAAGRTALTYTDLDRV